MEPCPLDELLSSLSDALELDLPLRLEWDRVWRLLVAGDSSPLMPPVGPASPLGVS